MFSEDVEPLEGYDSWDYYPTRIGTTLNNRYCIIHKLGHGGFSTVWLAHDTKEGRNVAMKILIAEYGDCRSRELDVQGMIEASVQKENRTKLLLSLATFSIVRPSGLWYRVLIFPLQGPTLYRCIEQKMEMKLRMSAAVQLLQAIATLHDARIVHGDITDQNVIRGVQAELRIYTGAENAKLRRPKTEPLPNGAGERVKPARFPSSLLSDEFYLGDLGVAFRPDGTIHRTQTPSAYRAPELIHGYGPHFASDMWSYMCVFAKLYTGMTLFGYPRLFGGGGETFNLACDLVGTLGPMPSQWKGTYTGGEGQDAWYDHGLGESGVGCRNLNQSLEALVSRSRPDVSLVERDIVARVMEKCFRYLPEIRVSAKDLLHDPDFETLLSMYA
ncbi:protein kinase [Lophiotrema nucula]|uniref:Protein kinase n=1 Tax=Lophiotrema nucula TaxID=690887 RepID=A0A6A5YHP3_9PLEO|nr:protein kinase [Lophiotrema nucula]